MKRESQDSSKLQRNLTVIACIAVIAVASFFIARGLMNRTPRMPGAYFVDLNTNKIFVAPANTMGPVNTPSGPFENEPAGVRIFMFSCSPCPLLDGKTIQEAEALGATMGWLEKYKPESKKLIEEGDIKPETLVEGLLMRAVSGGPWTSPSTREAQALREKIARLCVGMPGKACNPDGL